MLQPDPSYTWQADSTCVHRPGRQLGDGYIGGEFGHWSAFARPILGARMHADVSHTLDEYAQALAAVSVVDKTRAGPREGYSAFRGSSFG